MHVRRWVLAQRGACATPRGRPQPYLRRTCVVTARYTGYKYQVGGVEGERGPAKRCPGRLGSATAAHCLRVTDACLSPCRRSLSLRAEDYRVPAAERPPRAPLSARCGGLAGSMSVHDRRALDSSTLQPWLAHTVRRATQCASIDQLPSTLPPIAGNRAGGSEMG